MASTIPALADAVAQDVDVDWSSAESTASPEDRRTVRQLQLVAALGQAAKRLQKRWGPFELRGEIGRGAFGVVYRAWDSSVGREVALKLLNHGHAPATAPGEAIHEAALLGAVDHPNVVPVYGAAVHDGQVGVWMKLVEGATLKDLLRERGPFGAEEAARIGRALCGALSAVHHAGLVHRDIKAQNVLRETGGRIVLMDFGAGDRVDRLTAVDMKGAPAYLAPELLSGGQPTPASDVYSVGVLLYHLVSGEFPVTGTSWDELRRNHASRRSQLLRDARPDCPEWFATAVEYAVAPSAADRPATAGALANLLDEHARATDRKEHATWLRALVYATLAAVVASLGLWRWAQPPAASTAAALAPILTRGLAVRLSSPPNLDERASGVVTQLVASLTSRLRRDFGVRVPEPETLERLRDLSREQLVAVTKTGGVLTLTVDRAGRAEAPADALRVRVQIASSAPEWPELLDSVVHGSDDDPSPLVRDVVRTVGASLGLDAPDDLVARIPKDYAIGRYLATKLTERDLRRAIDHYGAAIAESPMFAPAYAARSEATVLLQGNHGAFTVMHALSAALEDARRATALDPTLGAGHTALAWASYYLGWDWAAAEASFKQAISADPGDGVSHHLYADFLSAMGRSEEALVQEQAAVDLDPASARFNRGIGWIRFFQGDFAGAASALEYTLSLEPDYLHARSLLARAYGHLGRHDEARVEMERVLEHDSGLSHREMMAELLALAGRKPEALRIVEDLVTRPQSGYVRPYFLALVWVALGEQSRALDELERAYREHDSTLVLMAVDPRFRHIRANDRFQSICRRLGTCP